MSPEVSLMKHLEITPPWIGLIACVMILMLYLSAPAWMTRAKTMKDRAKVEQAMQPRMTASGTLTGRFPLLIPLK